MTNEHWSAGTYKPSGYVRRLGLPAFSSVIPVISVLEFLVKSKQSFSAQKKKALFSSFFYPQLRTFCHCFLERRREREGEGEKNIDVKEKHRLLAFSYMPQPRIKPAT